MRSDAVFKLVGLAAVGCALGCATVSVDGVRKPGDQGTIEPVAFVIFESSTPSSYTQILQRTFSDEMQRRGIPAHFTIIPRPELRKKGALKEGLRDVPGFIIVAPSDGSPRLDGVVDPVFYDVRAFRILKHPEPSAPESGPDETTPINDRKGEVSTIWRGRAYAPGGFSDRNLAEVASRIVQTLVAAHVLRGPG